MKHFLSLILVIALVYAVSAQESRSKYTPFTAVKWLQYNPYVMIDGEWYLLIMVDNTEAKAIVDFCKSKYSNKWQKRFSEDFNLVLEEMGKPAKDNIKLKLIKDGKVLDKTLAMTSENRKKVMSYNRENPSAESGKTQKDIIEQVQKDIASHVNIKTDKLYPFKTAKFEFIYTGHKFYSGTETVYIDDYGKTVVIMNEKPNGPYPTSETIIWQANQSTVINHKTKTYYTSRIRPKSTEPPVISYSTPEQRKQGGYLKKPNESLIGKDCEVYEHSKMKVTYWLWKNYEFKLVNYSLGDKMGYSKEPKSVEENIELPESVFQIPKGYSKQ